MANSTAIRFAGSLDAPSALGQRNPLFTAAMLLGIAAAWDADAATVDTAAPPAVLSWTDGAKGVVLTSAAGTRPTKEGALNGKTPVRLTSGRFLSAPAITVPGSTFFACFFSLASAPSGGGKTILASGDGRFNFAVNGNGSFGCSMGSTTAPNVFNTSPAGVIKAGANLVVLYCDNDGLYHLRVNGVDVATATVNSATAFAAGGRVGLFPNGANPMEDGSIGALALAGGQQDLINVQKIEGLYAQRFAGVTFLPSDHPYRSIAPRALT